MDNLSQLFQLNPYVASGFAGEREAIGQGQELLRSQELAQLISGRMGQEQRAQALHPFDLRSKELSNQTAEAQLPGFHADSRKRGLEADLKAGTLQSDIETGKVKNATEAYTKVGERLGSIAGQLEGVSDIEAPYVLSDAFDSMNTPPQIKQAFMKRYGSLPAAEARKRMQADADKILREHPAHAQAYDTTSLSTSAGLLETGMRTESAERIAAADRAAGRFEKKGSGKDFDEGTSWAKRVSDARSAKERHSAALGAVEFWREKDPAKASYYQGIADVVQAQAQAEIAASNPRPGDVDVDGVTNGAVPTNPSVPIRGGVAQPPKPAASGSTTGIAEKVKAQGGVYDPSKFEYRINPETGKVQARPKQ
jgi:hypothetical protein